MELLEMGARWYDPKIGRWLSPDTIVPDPTNPQSLNRFSYVLGNPIRYRDPSGHAAECGTTPDGGCEGNPELHKTTEYRRDDILRYAWVVQKAIQKGQFSDLEGVALFTEYVASLQGGDFVSDVGMILTGLTGEHPGIDFLLGNQDSRYVDFLANEAVYGQTGSNPVFQDPVIVEGGNNQARHLWFYVQLTYHGGPVGPINGTATNWAHETFLVPSGRQSGMSYQDYAIGQVGVRLGYQLQTGDIAPVQVGDYLRENLSVDSNTAQYWRTRMFLNPYITGAYNKIGTGSY